MSFQALECILKVKKAPRRKKVDMKRDASGSVEGKGPKGPGARPDNDWMQYRSDMSEAELRVYWTQPFSTKPWLGFNGYPYPTRLRVAEQEEEEDGDNVEDVCQVKTLFRKYFRNADYVDRLVQFNSVEHRKGEDFFSMDKALFYAFLYESLGREVHQAFKEHIRQKAKSTEESQQR